MKVDTDGLVRFIGDIHADGAAYAAAVAGVDESIQVGDLEIGIAREENVRKWPCQPGSGHRFIRGNHDNPSVCRNHPQFIESGAEGDMFFVNGAWSIDQDDREENKDWWPDEEHSQRDLDLLFEAWSNSLDLSQNCSAPLTWYFATKEKHHGTTTDPGIPR